MLNYVKDDLSDSFEKIYRDYLSTHDLSDLIGWVVENKVTKEKFMELKKISDESALNSHLY